MQENEIKETAAPEEAKATEKGTTRSDKTDKKKIKKLEEELAAAKAEAQEINDKYLRMLAEYDNFRKRSAKEREGIYADAYADALLSVLPVLDNLERADACKESDALAKGLELTLKSFYDTLSKMGVEEIEAKTFDPNFHNAVMHIEDESYGESEIVEVLMKGYKKGDKVIRYAMVKVAN